MEALGVAAETRARIVPLDFAQLVAQPASQLLEGARGRTVRGRTAERPEQLRQALPGLGAGRDELAGDLVEPVGTAVPELDLDLDEVVARVARVQHRDLVRGHLGRRPVAVDELATPVRPELGYALERPAAQVGVQEGEQLLGRLPRPSLGLELEARVVGRELELPDAAAVLGAAPERDASVRQRPAGDVVVDGGEDPGRERATAERRQPEAGRRVELELMLTCRPHTPTIGLADELCQPFPRLPGLLLEAGREGPCGLEQKLLPTLGVDLAQQLIDPLPAKNGRVAPGAHAASCSSTASISSARSRAGRRKTDVTTNAATSRPPRTTKDV